MLPSYYEIETEARRLRREESGRLVGDALNSAFAFVSRWVGLIASAIAAGRRRAV